MKKLLIFLCFYVPLGVFCQSRGLVDSVNYAIAPRYVFEADTVAGTYHKFNLIAEAGIVRGRGKMLVVVAGNADSSVELNKVFVLSRNNDGLVIVDSSAAFTVGELGPRVDVKGSKILVTHDFEKGLNRLTYVYDNDLSRFMLQKLYYSNVVPGYGEDDHAVSMVQEYSVAAQVLSIKSSFRNFTTGKVDKIKKKAISQKIPAGTSLSLRKMSDPYDYDVFLTEGTLYDQMVKY